MAVAMLWFAVSFVCYLSSLSVRPPVSLCLSVRPPVSLSLSLSLSLCGRQVGWSIHWFIGFLYHNRSIGTLDVILPRILNRYIVVTHAQLFCPSRHQPRKPEAPVRSSLSLKPTAPVRDRVGPDRPTPPTRSNSASTLSSAGGAVEVVTVVLVLGCGARSLAVAMLWFAVFAFFTLDVILTQHSQPIYFRHTCTTLLPLAPPAAQSGGPCAQLSIVEAESACARSSGPGPTQPSRTKQQRSHFCLPRHEQQLGHGQHLLGQQRVQRQRRGRVRPGRQRQCGVSCARGDGDSVAAFRWKCLLWLRDVWRLIAVTA